MSEREGQTAGSIVEIRPRIALSMLPLAIVIAVAVVVSMLVPASTRQMGLVPFQAMMAASAVGISALTLMMWLRGVATSSAQTISGCT